jgi:hypothetical protein
MNNKNATQANQSSVINKQINISKVSVKSPLKIELCLMELLKRGDRGLVELEAFQAYNETCLHTTISTLANSKNLAFKREKESHIHQHRGEVYFTRYSLLNDEETNKALVLLNHYRSKRGLELAA